MKIIVTAIRKTLLYICIYHFFPFAENKSKNQVLSKKRKKKKFSKNIEIIFQ